MNAGVWLQSLAPSPGWLVALILVISLVESLAVIGLVVPGVVLITAAASMAGHYELSIPVILASAFAGAVIGDGISFLLGYTQRERIPETWPFRQHPEWLTRGANFFKRYGILSVLIGRFVGPVRPIVPMIAGMMHMSPATFAWSNLGSALLWAPAYVLPGYLLGRTWQQLFSLPPGSERWLILLGLTVVVLALVFSLLRHQLAREGRLYRLMAHLARRHSWSRQAWQALRLSSPSGEFPLASLVLLIISLTGLSAWTLLVLAHDGPLPTDRQLQSVLAGMGGPIVMQLAAWLQKTGDALGVLMLVLPWSAWLLFRKHFAVALHLLGGLAIILLANSLFGHLAGHAHPEMQLIAYPSALTSTAVVFSGLVAAQIAETLSIRMRPFPYWAAILFSLTMALASLILESALLSDIVGGAFLGLAVCALVRISYHYFMARPPMRAPWPLLGLASLILLATRVAWLPPL